MLSRYPCKRNGLARLCSNFYKMITLQSEFLRMFSCKQGRTSGSNTRKKIFWWHNSFINNYKDYHKLKYSKGLFGNMAMAPWSALWSSSLLSMCLSSSCFAQFRTHLATTMQISPLQAFWLQAGIFQKELSPRFPAGRIVEERNSPCLVGLVHHPSRWRGTMKRSLMWSKRQSHFGAPFVWVCSRIPHGHRASTGSARTASCPLCKPTTESAQPVGNLLLCIA